MHVFKDVSRQAILNTFLRFTFKRICYIGCAYISDLPANACGCGLYEPFGELLIFTDAFAREVCEHMFVGTGLREKISRELTHFKSQTA